MSQVRSQKCPLSVSVSFLIPSIFLSLHSSQTGDPSGPRPRLVYSERGDVMLYSPQLPSQPHTANISLSLSVRMEKY